MKAKTINQLWAQIGRIREYFSNPNALGQAERLNNACEICNRYGNKMYEYVISHHPDNNVDVTNVAVPVAEYTNK